MTMVARRKRFIGALLLFIGALVVLGALVGLAVLPDLATRPSPTLLDTAPSTYWELVAEYESELVRGWLIVLGTVVAAGVVLLAAVAPRTGYRWFDGALFLVPLYGQLVFAPRVLWRLSGWSRPWRRPPPERPAKPAGRAEVSSTPAGAGERSAVPEAEQIRQEARTLAALLSGRPQITLPDAGPRDGNGGGRRVRNGRSSPPGPPRPPEPQVEPGPPAAPRAPGEVGERPPGGRTVVWLSAVLLALVAVLAGIGAWQVTRSGDRADRLAADLRRARSDLAALREDLEAVGTDLAELTDSLPPDVPGLVAEAGPSVVTVEVPGQRIGSGFAIEAEVPEGFGTAILTTERVVRPAIADRGAAVLVTQGSRTFRASLGRWDRSNDLAMVYVRQEFPPIPFASAAGNQAEVGELVVAVGRPLGLDPSATVGVVSRLSDRLIATDATIAAGSSGGPMLNRRGEVLGVNTVSPTGAAGTGFAVPIDLACRELVRC